jgi:hypothetical protein
MKYGTAPGMTTNDSHSDSPVYVHFYERADFWRADALFPDFEAHGLSYEQYIEALRQVVADNLSVGELVDVIEFHVDDYLLRSPDTDGTPGALDDRCLWAVDLPAAEHHPMRSLDDLEMLLQSAGLKEIVLALVSQRTGAEAGRSDELFATTMSRALDLAEQFRQYLVIHASDVVTFSYRAHGFGREIRGTLEVSVFDSGSRHLDSLSYQVLVGAMAVGTLGGVEIFVPHSNRTEGTSGGFLWRVSEGVARLFPLPA